MSEELKPCPFCGNEQGKHDGQCYFVLHRRLLESPPGAKDTTAEVLAAWNRRVEDTELLRQQIERFWHDQAALDESNSKLLQDVTDERDQLRQRVAELEAEAGLYRFLRDIKCNHFTLSRDEGHAVNYQSLAQYVNGNDWYADVPGDVLATMIASNTDWQLQIYPDTPIGFSVHIGATLEAVISAAMAAK
jgi:hypothetical protein